MAVDTSALVSIVLGETDAERFAAALRSSRAMLSAVSLVEASIVVEARQGPDASRDLTAVVEHAVEQIVPVDANYATVALGAWRRFGKGRHPAALNFGDCFAYAVAQWNSVPLLYKGNDFAQTDVASAV
ncbi:MAG: type II toxin-antitoxin system VapC family toxin [Acidimicrobiia bacterium]|nr:type II toxin-antitoxin system VapC family toxin [Acidimicrobiia bacterium]MBP8180475.1 type II toxin-antitoxin system VapC family toxin [Acidimicrobiia bacterium]